MPLPWGLCMPGDPRRACDGRQAYSHSKSPGLTSYGRSLKDTLMSALKALFLLDPDVVFLNHGSFGACPLPVFATYQTWQRELERQPVAFLSRQAAALMANAREQLAAYLGAAADEVVYFPNPTTAINMVARSLKLRPHDEILTTD